MKRSELHFKRLTRRAAILLAVLMFVLTAPHAIAQEKQEAQKQQSKFLIISGDLHEPYEIVDAVFFVEEIKIKLLSFGGYPKAYNKAIQSVFKKIEKALAQHGDAVINTRIDVVLYPAAKGQHPGDLVIFGTLVKRL